MTETEDTVQKDYCEYVVGEGDFRLPPGSTPKDTPFGPVELVTKVIHTPAEPDEVVTDEKFVRISLSNNSNEAHIFAQQIDLFVQTEIHPSLVQFEGFEFLPNHRAITKYYPNHSLQHVIENARSCPQWDGTMKSKCVFGIVAALTHLHNIYDDQIPDFAIRYLSPENVMFDSNNEVRVINYVYGDEDIASSAAYIPPELHSNPKADHYDQDIWCFGMILFEILTGRKPYQGLSDAQIKAKIINGELPELPPPSNETDYVCGIIQNCLAKNPNDRPLFYHLYYFLDNLSEPLFPGTDMTTYESYKNIVSAKTVQCPESVEYMKSASAKPADGSTGESLEDKAAAGDPNALVRLGRCYQKGMHGYARDEKKGFELFQKAAESDYPIAMYNTAMCLLQGRGTRKDAKAAFKMMERAAPISDCYPLVLTEYGQMLRDGIGTAPKPAEAFKVFQRGADKNDGLSQYLLASMLIDGAPGVPQDINKALSLYDDAASNGCTDAFGDKAFYYLTTKGRDRDIEKAINLFKKGATKKNAMALLNLGKIYLTEKYQHKDLGQAVNYFSQGNDLNHPLCTIEYAKCLLKGESGAKNLNKARELFQKAIDNDRSGEMSLVAKFYLAQMLFNGEGGPQQIIKSAPLFKDVADATAEMLDSNEKKVLRITAMYYYGKILIEGLGGHPQNRTEGKRYMNNYITNGRKRKNFRIEPDAEDLAR